MSEVPRRVLVVTGETAPAGRHLLDVLRSSALEVVTVAREGDALRLLGLGEIPHAVLLLDCLQRRPDCFPDCDREERARLDCIIDCIRKHRGLESVPVMHYAPDEQSGLSPEELAALLSAAATMSDPAPPVRD